VWSGSAVRAILTNPRYLGHQVAGRQRRKDELLDPTDPAAGTTSRQRWQPTDSWVTSDEPAWPAIVDAALWERVNARITNTHGPQRRQPRATPGAYLLAGLVRCKVCGRSLHGATLKGNPYYRCNRVRPDYADTGHPRTTAIREDRIVSVLDDWLDQLTDVEHRETTIAAVLAADATQAPEPPEVQAARRALRDLPVELDRVLAAIRAGMDPDLAVITTKQIQRDLAAAEATITAWEQATHRPRSPPSRSAKCSTTPGASQRCCPRPDAKRGPGCTRPSISNCSSIRSETLRPWMFGCSYVVAGAGFEPATFGL
jgi:site-specific DNA recombinase